MPDVTVCIHGFFRTARDMRFLSDGLNKVGLESVALSLPTTFSSVESCAALLNRKLAGFAESHEKINYVGHSMGGLIIRRYINAYKPVNVGKCVFIATPHRGSRLARGMLHIPCVSTLLPPLADLESKKENEYLLKDKDLAVGIIVGSENSLLWGKLFLSDQSDGRVEIKSAISEDAKETVVLPYHHGEIHHVPETLKLVKRFIESATFGQPGAAQSEEGTDIFMNQEMLVAGLKLLAAGGSLPSMPNVPFPTMGGQMFWNDLAEYNGWRVQQNMVTQHCRVLDPDDTRVAWGGYDAMITAFDRLLKR